MGLFSSLQKVRQVLGILIDLSHWLKKMEKLTQGKLQLEPNHYSHPPAVKSAWFKDLLKRPKN